MRVLGIDPGSRATGYGLVDGVGGRPSHVDNGVITLSARLELPVRLARLTAGLEELVERHAPEAASVETVFAHRNVRSALVLAQARGAILAVLGRHHIPVFEYAPAVVKTTVTGYGRAEKAQMQKMIRMLLNLREDAASDASDALAVAICHVRSAKMAHLKAAMVVGR